MADSFELYLKHIQSFCAHKQLSNEMKNLIVSWFFQLYTFYDEQNNIFDGTAVHDYIDEFICILEDVKVFRLMSIDDIVQCKDEDCEYFYRNIKPVEDCFLYRYPFYFSKQNGRYVLDVLGNYQLSLLGCANYDSKKIIVLGNNLAVLHHELRHIGQKKNCYNYPSFLPLSFQMNLLLKEGDALYHQKLILDSVTFDDNLYSLKYIQSDTYSFYYQMYCILFLCLPFAFRKKWQNGIFDITIIPLEQQEQISKLFAILTIFLMLSDKINVSVLQLSLSQSDDFLQFQFSNAADGLNWNEIEFKKEKKELLECIQRLKGILQDEKLLKCYYLEDTALRKKMPFGENYTISDFKGTVESSLQKYLNSLSELNQDFLRSRASLEKDKSTYHFFLQICENIRILLDKDLNISQLYYDLITTAMTIQSSKEQTTLVLKSMQYLNNLKYSIEQQDRKV